MLTVLPQLPKTEEGAHDKGKQNICSGGVCESSCRILGDRIEETIYLFIYYDVMNKTLVIGTWFGCSEEADEEFDGCLSN